ncbi:MAG: hypothetical protein IJ371_04785 [Clostridia bacterium]|nr:hypothetical protein [Clostridia bacterium]
MPKLIKKVAGIEVAENGKVKCVRFEKDLTDVLKEEYNRINSNNNELGL